VKSDANINETFDVVMNCIQLVAKVFLSHNGEDLFKFLETNDWQAEFNCTSSYTDVCNVIVPNVYGICIVVSPVPAITRVRLPATGNSGFNLV
jgi:hypothetical protein